MSSHPEPDPGTASGASYPTVESCVGNTPLVRLQRLPGGTTNVVLVKLEGDNPAGSVKDRPAVSMIRHAEERGEISPGDTLIEATSGNTGIALAMAAAVPAASPVTTQGGMARVTSHAVVSAEMQRPAVSRLRVATAVSRRSGMA